jgi:hypothetical protein
MGLLPQLRLDAILAVLTEAARTMTNVRIVLRESTAANRPARIVEGVVCDVSDGRDGRTRVRLAIPTGAGDPVEVRILIESIDEAIALASEAAASAGPSEPQTHVSERMLRAPRTSVPPSPSEPPSARRPDETGPRRRPSGL